MFSFKFGRVFEVSSQLGDFLVRVGRRQFYWSRDTGFICERT
jgi:hypothetical protein